MKIIFVLFVFITSVSADDNVEIGFRYGLLGRVESKPDSTVVLSDSSIIYTGDEVQVNVGFLSESSFLLIFKGSEGEFYSLYNNSIDINSNAASKQDTTYRIAYPFNAFTDPPGLETFYLINSITPQLELIKLIERFQNAPEKAQVKLANQIQAKIDALNPNIKGDIADVQSRLDKPMVGGVSFRGEEDEGIHDMSVTHKCKGSDGVAFQRIVLNHRTRR